MKQQLAKDAAVALVLGICTGPLLDGVFGVIPGRFAQAAAQIISPLNAVWWFMVFTGVLFSVLFRYWQLSKEQK